MTDEADIKYIIETTNSDKALALTQAIGMKVAINSIYNDVLRSYLKYDKRGHCAKRGINICGDYQKCQFISKNWIGVWQKITG